jgi:Na+/H+ antiporter NhaD/arsenite permease-like protein
MSETIQWVSAAVFALAIVHTFSTKFFERLAHHRPEHAGMWHLLGEVEVVFGFWAMVLVLVIAVLQGPAQATEYVDSRDYTEPMFVFAIMVIAGSRSVLHAGRAVVARAARLLPTSDSVGMYFLSLSLLPLMGSLITEPAAMTLAALMLREQVFRRRVSNKLKYATLGVLFVNISIGGTLTHFAAPPVLMVASTWNWDSWHMLSNFGWKAALAVAVNAVGVTLLFKRELAGLPPARRRDRDRDRLPPMVVLLHLALLAGVVAFSHHPPVFLGVLLFFLGFAGAYPQFQDRVMLREGLLVAFFLAGLVVLGGQQQWWLDPLLRGMDAGTVFYAATALTALTDNAALTYLASLVEGLSEEFKYSIVAGAVTGGGLTVIANAPNPAGFSILRRHFDDEAVHPLGLLGAALAPTFVALLAFRIL